MKTNIEFEVEVEPGDLEKIIGDIKILERKSSIPKEISEKTNEKDIQIKVDEQKIYVVKSGSDFCYHILYFSYRTKANGKVICFPVGEHNYNSREVREI